MKIHNVGYNKMKKRKAIGFGSKNQDVGVYVFKSDICDSHAIFFGANGKSIGRLSSHNSIVVACTVLRWCEEILKNLDISKKYSEAQIFYRLATILEDKHGYYESDDGQFAVDDGDCDAIVNWVTAGNILGIDEPPDSITIVTIKPHTFKKWKIFERKVEGFPASKYGDPSSDHQFYIAQSADSMPILIARETDGPIICPPCSRYVSAAYIADFANDNHKSLLNIEELIRLLTEANALQGILCKGKTDISIRF